VAAQVPGAAVVSPALRSAAVVAQDAGPIDTSVAPGAAGTPLALPRDAHAATLVERLSRALERCIPSVLVGETGTGKEALAHCAHEHVRAGRPFVSLSCAGLQPGALDAALCDGALGGDGTLYLDDIGDLPQASQQRLLRLLDVRAAAQRSAALRLVCASREPLRALLDGGRLGEDLCYRLNGLTLRAPPLRERSDLIELAHDIVAQEAPGQPMRLAADVIALLRAHRWPGNLRQLHNVLRTAVALAQGDEIQRAHLSEDIVEEAQSPAAAGPALDADKPQQSLDDLTLEAISQAVDAAHGNISEASRQLGISRNTIYRKLRWNRAPS